MHNLERFVSAQQQSYPTALAEIRQGRKRSHWMWYIFPQLKGLGFSDTARYYGIEDLEEAKAYMRHPSLRQNLIQITQALLKLDQSDPVMILGDIDGKKLRSCMTLFEAAAPEVPEFAQALEKFYYGKRDGRTLSMLKKHQGQ